MTKFLKIFILPCLLAGCFGSNSDTKQSPSSAVGLSFDCEKSFKAEQCYPNLATSSDITTICSGVFYSGDIIYYPYYLTSNQGNSCLIDLGPGAKKVDLVGCANATETTYSSALGPVQVTYCQDSSGNQSHLYGTNADGQEFKIEFANPH